MFTNLLNFCSNDLSSFYFDIRKDTIYCDNIKSKKRRATRTLLDILFNFLVRWLAPSLAFTCEEAWQSRGNISSIHLEEFLIADKKFKNEKIANKWQVIKDIRKVITGALEKKRENKTIGSSLEAQIDIFLSNDIKSKIENVDMAEVSITSSAKIITDQKNLSAFTIDEIKDIAVNVKKSSGSKCERCWKYESKINSKGICNRCDEAL